MTATLSQNDAILALLQLRPAGITAIEALEEVGCFRLAARVGELRAQGYYIRSVDEMRNGKRFVRYQLVPTPSPEGEQRMMWGDR